MRLKRPLHELVLLLGIALVVAYCSRAAAVDELEQALDAMQMQNPGEAEELIAQVLEQSGETDTKTLKAEYVRCLLRQYDSAENNPDTVVAGWQMLLDKTPPEMQRMRALILLQMGETYDPPVHASPVNARERWNKALPFYQRVVQEFPDLMEAAVASVEIAQTLRRIDPDANREAAMTALMDALDREPGPAARETLVIEIANQYMADRDWVHADRWLRIWAEGGVRSYQIRPQVHYSIARINHLHLDRPDVAIKHYLTIAEDYPYFPTANDCRDFAQELMREAGGADE